MRRKHIVKMEKVRGGLEEQRVPEKEMIGIKFSCRAAWAQLEHHYGITIIAHHLARCISAPSSEVLPLQSAIISSPSFSSGPRRRLQEQRLCVGDTYYSRG